MRRGTFVVVEGIYGSGRLLVQLVDRLRAALVAGGSEVVEFDSPDSGRARLMGAGELDASWRYGRFMPDFFFELASRARVCSVADEALTRGKVVLCKSFTLSSVVSARLQGHDWRGEQLDALEARARRLPSGGALAPDLTLFVDVAPPIAIAELGARLAPPFTQGDIGRQRQLYLEEIGAPPAPGVSVLAGDLDEEALVAGALAAIRAVR